MLRFFELERTAYLIDRDLTNRPDWARIPMTAMLRLVEG
jgi:predicted trehalose synthase